MSDDTAPVLKALKAAGFTTLGDDPPVDRVEAAARELVTLLDGADPTRRAAALVGAKRMARGFGAVIEAAFGGAAVDGASDAVQGGAVVLSDPEPWPGPVDGAVLLDEIVGAYRRFIVLPEGGAYALAPWVLCAHTFDAFDTSPLLAITAPEKRTGKTNTLRVTAALVPRPLPASNVTPAALFRAVEAYRPTLLVDEADTFIRESPELRGVLNSGHNRGMAVVVRTVGDDHEPRTFSTWCPKAIALIGDLPPTLTDRSIRLRLRRKRPDEAVEKVRELRLRELEPLRRQAWRWARDHADALAAADPVVPEALNDRAADNWAPLLAVADLAGGPWPERARTAALALSQEVEDESPGVMLLADVRALFEERGVDRLATPDIVSALVQREDRPWPEWRRGNPLTARAMAKLLKPYGIAPRQMKLAGDKARGYDRADFEDAWARYLEQGVPDRSGTLDLSGTQAVPLYPLGAQEDTAKGTGSTGSEGGAAGDIYTDDPGEQDELPF